MKNIKFTESIIINTSQQVAFDFTQDYGNRLRWDTFLKKAELINGATEAGVGVRAWCVAKNGLGMETKYVSFNRSKATAIKMTKGPYMFSAFFGSWTFKEITPAQTEVIFLYSFSLRFPFNLFAGIATRNLQNNVKQRLLDLKKNMEV
ncbi:ribosome-associated toxin RatA of RatAB toxin-antitoxin module [Mucilaginibacter sp. UYP25]|uniref:SRPBCC family protein n=1 Tax=unclassified Mucilaginibacter TaxID=2617802 RepID=UPI0033988213